MPCVSLQRNFPKFQEKSFDLETRLLELGFLYENNDGVGQVTASFSYNAHGSMVSMPHLSAMDWDFAEKLCHITRGTTEAYYNYDGNGIRTRKVVKKNGTVETRLYLGGFEIWRKTVNGTLETERETLHVMDDKKRIAIVETLTVENGNRVANPAPVQRYQLDNHLGSASLELDASANVISYEEYYPYGDTSYRAGRNASEVSQKRYRYTGKEKDEESSLYYCEQRYYAAHISRWVSTDPTWLEDGINLYAYVHGNPVSGVDPSGTQTVDVDEIVVEENNQSNSFSNIKKERMEDCDKDCDYIDSMPVPDEIKQQLHEFRDKIISYGYLEKDSPLVTLIKKMVSHHLSMDPKLELTTIGVTLDEVYVGFQRKENNSHTMGGQFVDILKATKKDALTIIVHLHPLRDQRPNPQGRDTMFSEGDQANMGENQIWIGLQIYPNKDGSYSVDVYASTADYSYEDKKIDFTNMYNPTEKKRIIPAVYLKTFDGIKAKERNFKEYRMKER